VRSVLSFVLFCLASGGPQSGRATSGTLAGTALDPSSAAIFGANVALSTPDGSLVTQTVTDASGGFRFDNLAPGSYVITVSAEGFRDATVPVKLGKTAGSPLRIVLQIATQSETVTIAGGDAVAQINTEISENQSANTMERSALDQVPVFDQDYITTLSRFLSDDAIGTNGVTLVVNGVESNGPGVTPSAVQEVKINQNPYSALFSRPGRARLEIVTKGGTPKYHGTVNFLYRDSVFDARNAYASSKPPERRQYYEGSLTGPIGSSKKTTFLLSLEGDVNNQQAIVNAQDLNGAVHQNVASPLHHFFGSGRIFHDFNQADQFWIAYSFEHESIINQNVGGTTLPEAGSDFKSLEHEVNVSYRHLFSAKWVNQLRFLVGHNNEPVISHNAAQQIIVSGAFVGGGAQADSRRTESHFDGQDIINYASGKHAVNFGIDIPDISRRGADDFTNFAGTYTYGCLFMPGGDTANPNDPGCANSLQANKPSRFFVQRGQGHLTFLETTFALFAEDAIRLRPNLSISIGVRYYWQNFFHDDADNFAPRFSIAWAPSRKSKTVFRGGAGVFYDRSGPRPIADLLHFNGINLQRFILTNPPFPVTPADLANLPTSVIVLDPRARIPYTVQYSMGIERQVTAKSTFTATYVGSHGIHLFRSIDANAPVFESATGTFVRPNAQLGQQRQMQSEGYQKSNALELIFRGKPSKLFSGQVQYTLSKTYNNTAGIVYFPANSFNPAADWARSDNDRRHKFDLLGAMQASKVFTVGMALSLYSGKPVNVTTGSDNNQDGVVNDRPFLANSGVSTGVVLPRNTLHGPGLINLDLNVAHDFILSKDKKEARSLTVALNSFNVLNHRNGTTYIGVCGASILDAGGCPASPFFGRAVSALPPRRMQLNLTFKF
jgi:hypothetical protein